MHMKMFAAAVFALLSLGLRPALAMTVDGQLDEAEWAQAQVFTDFRVLEPLTREVPPQATQLRILPLPDGLYVGLRSEMAPELRTYGSSPRDAPRLDADPAILLIDFEGLGKTAYEFSISLSGSKRDGIILNQNQQSRDWDADWQAAVHEDATGWSAEWLIPWSVAPEGATRGDKRTIAVYASRYIKRNAHRYAFPAIEYLGANFVRDFQQLEVPRYSSSSLVWLPYVSLTHDTLNDSSKGHAGVDVFWKPNGRNQLSVSLNPDFGQVESDDLIVNFSPVETFFEEKRPFFTQGQQLFDLRASRYSRLVNTRRIGAAPDSGPEAGSDVLAAVKYTGIRGDNEFGVFGAAEDHSAQAQGRRYLTARWRHSHDGYSLGYLGTATLRPTLARDAYVHAIDYSQRLHQGMALSGQVMMSDIHIGEAGTAGTAATDSSVSRGYGTWARFDYQPGTRWQHKLTATWYDRHLDINDLGYQERANIVQLDSITDFFTRQYRASAPAESGFWELALGLPYNTYGQRLVTRIDINHEFQWRNGAESFFFYVHEFPGFDDLITRGNGALRMPTRHNYGGDYRSPAQGRFRYYAKFVAREQGFTGLTQQLNFEPSWFLTGNLVLGLPLELSNSPNWLLWTAGSQVATYHRHEFHVGLNASWYPTARQELRLKFQWVGLGAQALQLYQLLPDGTPLAIAGLPSDFTDSTFATQLRYRFEFKPQSELYVVYSRGGDGSLDDRTESLAAQFRRARDQITTSQFFVKLRYRI
jgi:hypothetical protein